MRPISYRLYYFIIHSTDSIFVPFLLVQFVYEALKMFRAFSYREPYPPFGVSSKLATVGARRHRAPSLPRYLGGRPRVVRGIYTFRILDYVSRGVGNVLLFRFFFHFLRS
jgi:hypothetical protein